MALVKCPECGREKVSDSAEACPDCGYGIKKYYEESKIKKYYTCDTLFSFINGLEDGTNGVYTVNNNDTKREYKIMDNVILLPSNQRYLILDDFLLQENCKEFDGLLPTSETFEAVITENISKRKWTFYKDGVIKKDNGEIGIYKRNGNFLVYKIANHSGLTWRDRPMFLVIYNDIIYDEGRCYISEKLYSELICLKNEIQKKDYPFTKPEPLESVNYSYMSSNIPKCPICNSTNLTKISNAGKAAKVGFFGIFGAGDLGKTWKCNNCGSRF